MILRTKEIEIIANKKTTPK